MLDNPECPSVRLSEVVAMVKVKTGVTCNAVCPEWVETPRKYILLQRWFTSSKLCYPLRNIWVADLPQMW